jgi:hypothetical protein
VWAPKLSSQTAQSDDVGTCALVTSETVCGSPVLARFTSVTVPPDLMAGVLREKRWLSKAGWLTLNAL